MNTSSERAVDNSTVNTGQKALFTLPFAREYQLPLVFLVPLLIATAIWTRLPNSIALHKWELGLDLFGLLNASYLSLIPIFGDRVLPLPYRSVLKHVNASGYHVLWGIPNAWLGAMTYAMMALTTWVACNNEKYHELASLAILGLATIGVVFSVRLMWAMFLKIRHVCPFCVISAGTMTTVFFLALAHLVTGGAKLPF